MVGRRGSIDENDSDKTVSESRGEEKEEEGKRGGT